jgi:hypothetical protein
VAAHTKALELDPMNKGSLRDLGLEQYEIGEYALAIESLRRGLELHVGDDTSRVRIVQAQALLGDLAGAVKSLEAIANEEELLTKAFADARFDELERSKKK